MAALTARPVPAGLQYALIVVLAAAMGAQNATARKLAVPDLTTTVLTLTITGIAADSPLASAKGAKAARRLISVAAMLLGALVGALLVVHVRIVFPLVIALLILVAVALTAVARSRSRGRSVMRLAVLSSEEMTAEQVDLYREILGGPRGQGPRAVALSSGAGGLAGPFNAMLYAPAVGHALQELGAAIRFRTQLPPRIREMAILVVAQAWDSGYERASHEPIGREAGLAEPEIEALRVGADPGFADKQEQVAYSVVRALTGPDRRPGRPGVRHRGRGARRAGPGRAVRTGRLLRDPGPAAAHLPGPRALAHACPTAAATGRSRPGRPVSLPTWRLIPLGCRGGVGFVRAAYGAVQRPGVGPAADGRLDRTSRKALHLSLFGYLIRHKVWLAGIGMVIVAAVCQATALATGPVALVQPIFIIELPFTLLVASRLAHRKLPRRTWWAVGLVTVALGAGLAAAAPSGGGTDASPKVWAAALIVTGIFEAVVITVGVRTRGTRAGRRSAWRPPAVTR